MKIKLSKKIKIGLLIIGVVILILISPFAIDKYKVFRNDKFINNINTELSITVNDDLIKGDIPYKENFDKETKKSYSSFDSRVINMDLKDMNKDLKPINLETPNSEERPSVRIDYDSNTKPSIVEVAIQSSSGELCYWDYKVKDDTFLNFVFPDPVLGKKGIHYVQVNTVWEKNEKILGIRTYSFNINSI